MRDSTWSIDCRKSRLCRSFESKPMIVRRNFHFSCLHINHRLIDAAMPELQLICFKAQRTSQYLVAKANTEDWDLRRKYRSNQIN